jgi:hypothetical protein
MDPRGARNLPAVREQEPDIANGDGVQRDELVQRAGKRAGCRELAGRVEVRRGDR